MLIQRLISDKKNYESTVRIRLTISLALIIIGITAAVVAIIYRDRLPNDFFRGVYEGSGVGFIIGGIVIFVTNIRLLKNKKKAVQKEIEEKDERNSMIRSKAVSTAYYWGVMIMLVGSLISGIFSTPVFWTLFISSMSMLVIMVIAALVYNKKY